MLTQHTYWSFNISHWNNISIDIQISINISYFWTFSLIKITQHCRNCQRLHFYHFNSDGVIFPEGNIRWAQSRCLQHKMLQQCLHFKCFGWVITFCKCWDVVCVPVVTMLHGSETWIPSMVMSSVTAVEMTSEINKRLYQARLAS